jgi:hypothetical protein
VSSDEDDRNSHTFDNKLLREFDTTRHISVMNLSPVKAPLRM